MNDILLTGHRKCGTTLLLNLLDNHYELACYPEDICIFYGYFPHFTRECSKLSPTESKDRLDSVIFGMMQRKSQNRNYEEQLNIRNFREIFWKSFDMTGIYDVTYVYSVLKDAWRQHIGSKNQFVFKETSMELSLTKLINANFRPRKVIQLVRDPRDNFAAIKAGMKHYTAIGDTLVNSYLSTLYRIKLGSDLIGVNEAIFGKENYLVLRYEDLVKQSEDILKNIAEFLEIKFSKSMLVPTIMGVPHGGNNHDGRKNFQISGANISRWHERISEIEAMKIEFHMSSFMDKFGYQRNFTDLEIAKYISEEYLQVNTNYLYNDSFANAKYR